MQKLVKIPDDAPDAMRESMEAHNAPILREMERREAYIEAQRRITKDENLNASQKRQKFDALREYINLGGDASSFEKEWPQIRRELLTQKAGVSQDPGAARRLKF